MSDCGSVIWEFSDENERFFASATGSIFVDSDGVRFFKIDFESIPDPDALDDLDDILSVWIDYDNDGGDIFVLGQGNNMNGFDMPEPPGTPGFDDAQSTGSGQGGGGGVVGSGTVLFQIPDDWTGTDEELLMRLAEAQLALRVQGTDGDEGSLKIGDIGEYCPPPPPPVDEYCYTGLTRGAWGTPDNGAGVWNDGYLTGQSFEALFKIDVTWVEPGKGKPVFQDLTLLEAVKFNGGGQNQLAAQATAALLNADDQGAAVANGDSGYRFTEAEIKNAVLWAFGLDADIDGDGDVDSNNLADNVYNATVGNFLATTFDEWNNAGNAEGGEICIVVPEGESPPSLFDLMSDAFLF